MYVGPSEPFEAVFDSGVSGQIGTVQVKVIDNDGATVIGPTGTNIAEDGASGVYIWNAPAAPATLGQYSIEWSLDGSFTPAGGIGIDELIVVSGGFPPISVGSGLALGPCTTWTTAEDVAFCCSVDVGSEFSLLDSSVDTASQLLYELSGRLFSGLCSKTVRPCGISWCGFQTLSRGHIIDGFNWNGSWWDNGDIRACGCQPLSRVLLSGYPVRDITEVKIDGLVIDPSTYRLDERRWLTRVRDPLDSDTVLLWPNCQALDLDENEIGTFSVTYTYGQNPPLIGQEAAKQLACEIYKACATTGADCILPSGVTRIVRQGITIERNAFASWAFRDRTWRTGLPLVDAFLGTYARNGVSRRPAVWSPLSRMRYARPVGLWPVSS